MASYEIPRNTKGEGRLFYIFSTKALIYTVVGILIGWLFRFIFVAIGSAIPSTARVMSWIGIITIIIFALLGFAIAAFKVPQIDRFDITRKAAGINIDKVLWESIKFKFKKTRYYVYDTKELVRDEIIKEEEEEKEEEEKEEKERFEKEAQNNKNRRGYIRNGR